MDGVFLKLLNMSISAGWMALAVMVIRLLLRSAPKYWRCILWGLVGLRLVCPVSLESALSLLPSAQTVPPEIMYAETPAINTGIPLLNQSVNPLLSTMQPVAGDSVNPLQVVLAVAANVWLLGVMAMVLYTVISYIRLYRRVAVCVREDATVRVCDNIPSPFILGVWRPQICLPSSLSEEDRPYVLAHERAHLARRDHWWKPLGFALLTVYWFHPVLWVAYWLLCRDIELACDERVLVELGTDRKKAYAGALINCSDPHRRPAACPLAFGETAVKGRVASVLNYRRPAFWMMVVAALVTVALAIGFLTDPVASLPGGSGIVGTSSGAECANVQYHYVSDTVGSGQDCLEAQWSNGRTETISVQEGFWLSRDGETAVRYPAPAVTVSPSATYTESYDLSAADLGQNGSYRLERWFTLEGDPDTVYTAFVGFLIGTPYVVAGQHYEGDRVVFRDETDRAQLFTDESIPRYRVTADMHLFSDARPDQNLGSGWYDWGQLQEVTLSKEIFDDRMAGDKDWFGGHSAAALRRANYQAFFLMNVDQQQEFGLVFLLMVQKNGDVYLAYGYTATNRFRYVFKLREGTVPGEETLCFEAQVVSVGAGTVTVCPQVDSWEARYGDRIVLVVTDEQAAGVTLGDTITVWYRGPVYETGGMSRILQVLEVLTG